MKKIDLNNVSKADKIRSFDVFRDGVSPDLDTGKVSAVLVQMAGTINDLIDLVLKMRDRKKPGPKPKNKTAKELGGGLT